MKQTLKNATLLISPVLLVAVFVYFVGIAYAANTHSIDLESTLNQYLTAADSPSLSITGNLTLEAWVKFESLPDDGVNKFIVTKLTQTGGNRSWRFSLIGGAATDELLFEISSDGTSAASQVRVNWNPSIGVWYHVAVVYTASAGTANFYVNGQQQGTQQTGMATSIYDGTSLVYIGSINSDYGAGGDYEFDGQMDDVRIWNVARTATEIADNYNKELAGGETDLKAYWKLNNVLTDSTANGNNLTNNNGAVFSTDTPFTGPVFTVRKATDESVTSSTTLQNDDDLKVTLEANTTYILDGTIFVSSTSANPGFKIAFAVPTGATMDLGYTAVTPGRLQPQGELLETSGTASQEIAMRANATVVIHVSGTVKMSTTAGDVLLQWAQFTSDVTAVKVLEGGYLRADQL